VAAPAAEVSVSLPARASSRELMSLAKASCARVGELLAAGPTLTEIVTAKSPAARKQVVTKLHDSALALSAAAQILSHEKLSTPTVASQKAVAKLHDAVADYQARLDDLKSRAQERFSTPVDLERRVKLLTHQQTRELVRDLQEFRLAFWAKLFEFPFGRRRHTETILNVARRGITNNHHFLADQGDGRLVAAVKARAVQIAKALPNVTTDPFASLDEATSAKVASLLCTLPPKPEKAISVSREVEARVKELVDLETRTQVESYERATTPEEREHTAVRIRELQLELGGTALVARQRLKQLLACREPYLATKDYVFLANVPLFGSLFGHWQPAGFDTDDLRQAAHIGLLKAVERFDLGKNTTFATCASIWMRQSINAFIGDTGNIVYVPPHLSRALKEIRTNETVQTSGADLSEIAARLEISPDQARALLRLSARVLRVHRRGNEDKSGHMIIASQSSSPEATAHMKDLAEEIMRHLHKLPERERIIIQSRFGIQTERTYTLEELSGMFNVSRERIRQIEAKVLSDLASGGASSSLRSLKDTL